MTNYSAFHWSEKARKYAETVGTIFNVKGRVNTVADLPISGNKVGDLYLVGLSTDADLTEYAWLSFDGTTRWEKLGSTATSLTFSALTGSPNDNVALKNALDGKYSTSNPDGYISGITSSMVTTALGYTPQQQLVSGTNIKTINNNSILGSGNLTLDGLPSQTGQNGKFLKTDGTSASWSVPKTFNLLDFKWTDHIISDVSWVRADTFSWLDGTVYQSVYDLLEEEFMNGETHTDTIGGITIEYRLSPNGFKIVNGKSSSDVSNVEQLFNQTGVAWYYILHREGFRFKLPRTKYGFTGLRDAVGNYVPESLPNITSGNGNIVAWYNNQQTWTQGAVQKTSTENATLSSGGNWSYTGLANFNASRSSSAYQNGAPVQQRATQMYLYFYVGEYSQTATEQTAGLNAELFNGKVDLNASNLNTDGKSMIAKLGMPSGKYDNLTLGASGTTYTAPANGYFAIAKLSTAANQMAFLGAPTIACQSWSSASNQYLQEFVPVKAGQVVNVSYSLGGATAFFRFVYAEGEQ